MKAKWKRSAVTAVSMMLLAACGSSGGGVSDDPYSDYLRLSDELGGLGAEISAEDAAIRAMLNCDDGAKDAIYNGMSLSAFPTDLALVRAYCPDKEW